VPDAGGAAGRMPRAPRRAAGNSVAIGSVSSRRIALEWTLHAVAAAVLLWVLVQSVGGKPASGREGADPATLPSALVRWSTVAAPPAVDAEVGLPLLPATRDWLAALPGAATRVSWHARALPEIALAVSPVPDPAGVTRLRLAASPGVVVTLRDRGGVLDTVTVGAAAGASITTRGIQGVVDAEAAHTTASAYVTAPLVLRHVLVLGQVGWESRFVVDALEERGWRVDTRLSLAPHSDMRQGATEPLDTAHYAAVVVTDSSGVTAASRLVAYVRSGGGLVLAGTAAAMPAIRDLAPGTPGVLVPGTAMGPGDSVAAAAKGRLALLPVAGLRSDAVPLEMRDRAVAVAARRVGEGRVVQSGYLDTWRWRMATTRGEGAQRDWWAGLVGAVAYAPRQHAPPALPVARRAQDNVPAAAAIDALGPMTPVLAGPSGPAGSGGRTWLFAVIVIALLAEWASRRFRGAT
jgi:hypothetical protein